MPCDNDRHKHNDFMVPKPEFFSLNVCRNEDGGFSAMDYQAVILGLFRRLNQDSNIQLDFIDETALNEAELKPYKALIVTGASDNTQHVASCLLPRPSDRQLTRRYR